MNNMRLTDFDRIEDIAAASILAGQHAAAGLPNLDIYTVARSANLNWLAEVLCGDGLFEERSHPALNELEEELRRLADEHVCYSVPSNYNDEDYDYAPDRNFTPKGYQIEQVRLAVAAATAGARYTRALVTAEKIVSRMRGIPG